MDPRLPQPVSREQIVAIIRQRAERNLDQAIAPGAPPRIPLGDVPHRPMGPLGVAQPPRIGILPPPPPPLPLQAQQPRVVVPRGIMVVPRGVIVDHLIRPSSPSPPPPPAADGSGIGLIGYAHFNFSVNPPTYTLFTAVVVCDEMSMCRDTTPCTDKYQLHPLPPMTSIVSLPTLSLFRLVYYPTKWRQKF